MREISVEVIGWALFLAILSCSAWIFYQRGMPIVAFPKPAGELFVICGETPGVNWAGWEGAIYVKRGERLLVNLPDGNRVTVHCGMVP